MKNVSLPACTRVVRDHAGSAGTITLDETARYRRQIKMISDQGVAFMLDLPQARLLRHGDGLVLHDGRVIEVRARPEALIEVRGRDRRHLLTIAWQIGNRHLAAQIEPHRILIRRDHVIAKMLRSLGASITDVEEPFNPEAGAYGDSGHGRHHHHG